MSRLTLLALYLRPEWNYVYVVSLPFAGRMDFALTIVLTETNSFLSCRSCFEATERSFAFAMFVFFEAETTEQQ